MAKYYNEFDSFLLGEDIEWDAEDGEFSPPEGWTIEDPLRAYRALREEYPAAVPEDCGGTDWWFSAMRSPEGDWLFVGADGPITSDVSVYVSNEYTDTSDVSVYSFGPEPDEEFGPGGLLEGIEKEALGGDDYNSERALALYAALGVPLDSEEETLGSLPDGRWALVGLTVEGHPFAVEDTPPMN